MEKISKLATVVAKAARMDKKAEYYDAIATFINPDGNYFEKRKFMGEYTEEEIIKEVLKEFPKVKKEDINIEFGVQSSKKSNLNKKAEEKDYLYRNKLWKNIFKKGNFETIIENISEDEAKELCEELQFEHKNKSYKQDLLDRMAVDVEEANRIAYDALLWFIDENKAKEMRNHST